jgi:hypothetical protein
VTQLTQTLWIPRAIYRELERDDPARLEALYRPHPDIEIVLLLAPLAEDP